MKHLFTCYAALLLLLAFGSCKKGPEDPFLSLSSRKARVSNRWHLKAGSIIIGITNQLTNKGYNKLYEFGKSGYTLTYTGVSAPAQSQAGEYYLNITFDKKGNLKFSEIIDGDELVAEGAWDFNNGVSKDIKKKEELIMAFKSVSDGVSAAHLFNQGSMNFRYKIKELKGDEMTLTADLPLYSDARGTTQTFSAEFKFIN